MELWLRTIFFSWCYWIIKNFKFTTFNSG